LRSDQYMTRGATTRAPRGSARNIAQAEAMPEENNRVRAPPSRVVSRRSAGAYAGL
jgi:hypothetical protein